MKQYEIMLHWFKNYVSRFFCFKYLFDEKETKISHVYKEMIFFDKKRDKTLNYY